jgi:hypothetical protein
VAVGYAINRLCSGADGTIRTSSVRRRPASIRKVELPLEVAVKCDLPL